MVVVIFSFFRCEHLGLTLHVWACLGQVVYADTIGINQITLMSILQLYLDSLKNGS